MDLLYIVDVAAVLLLARHIAVDNILLSASAIVVR